MKYKKQMDPIKFKSLSGRDLHFFKQGCQSNGRMKFSDFLPDLYLIFPGVFKKKKFQPSGVYVYWRKSMLSAIKIII